MSLAYTGTESNAYSHAQAQLAEPTQEPKASAEQVLLQGEAMANNDQASSSTSAMVHVEQSVSRQCSARAPGESASHSAVANRQGSPPVQRHCSF